MEKNWENSRFFLEKIIEIWGFFLGKVRDFQDFHGKIEKIQKKRKKIGIQVNFPGNFEDPGFFFFPNKTKISFLWILGIFSQIPPGIFSSSAATKFPIVGIPGISFPWFFEIHRIFLFPNFPPLKEFSLKFQKIGKSRINPWIWDPSEFWMGKLECWGRKKIEFSIPKIPKIGISSQKKFQLGRKGAGNSGIFGNSEHFFQLFLRIFFGNWMGKFKGIFGFFPSWIFLILVGNRRAFSPWKFGNSKGWASWDFWEFLKFSQEFDSGKKILESLKKSGSYSWNFVVLRRFFPQLFLFF